MPRLRKLRRKQKFKYHVNRRRLDEKINKKLPKINCDAVREAWDEKKSISQNLTSMGLVADPNSDGGFKISSRKKDQLKGSASGGSEAAPEKSNVANALEKQARDEFVKKKEVAHSLPPEMFKKLCKFIDKYGEDYEAMAKDHTNYYQETPNQIRKQIERLKNIPQQWIPYLRSRRLVAEDATV